MAREDEAGLGLRWVRLALLVVIAGTVCLVVGLLEWAPPLSSLSLPRVLLYAIVGLLVLLTGGPFGMALDLPPVIAHVIGHVFLASLVLLIIGSVVWLEIARRKRVSILPSPSDSKAHPSGT